MFVPSYFLCIYVANFCLSYLFGGASVGEGVGYGDVYVLSLPSFTWIKVGLVSTYSAEVSVTLRS